MNNRNNEPVYFLWTMDDIDYRKKKEDSALSKIDDMRIILLSTLGW